MNWGPATWEFIHTFIEVLKEDTFIQNRKSIIEFIISVLTHLPCPMCSDHAKKYLYHKNHLVNRLKTKQDLKLYIFNFHNNVNDRTKKTIHNVNILSTYRNKHIVETYQLYTKSWLEAQNSSVMLMSSSSFVRRNFVQGTSQWLKEHKHLFTV
jgi:hypothetical protein|uniref:thiol oxidase n=1 Tax=viral metagenome TaxID=1070528 RepID=A0A6C0JG48_9ZZZZ